MSGQSLLCIASSRTHARSQARCTSAAFAHSPFVFVQYYFSGPRLQNVSFEPSGKMSVETCMPMEPHLDLQHKALGGSSHDQSDSSSAAALAASQTSDTLDASVAGPPSRSPDSVCSQDLSSQNRPESVPAHALPSKSPPLYSPRSTRSHSLAASLASGSQSPIRRKPLSPTASPLAVRFSSKGFHMPHDLPHPPESGYFSLDSPELYDLKASHTPSRNLSEALPVLPLAAPLETEPVQE